MNLHIDDPSHAARLFAEDKEIAQILNDLHVHWRERTRRVVNDRGHQVLGPEPVLHINAHAHHIEVELRSQHHDHAYHHDNMMRDWWPHHAHRAGGRVRIKDGAHHHHGPR